MINNTIHIIRFTPRIYSDATQNYVRFSSTSVKFSDTNVKFSQ